MLPIALDVENARIAVIGAGQGLLTRLARLDESGAKLVSVFTDEKTDVSAYSHLSVSIGMPTESDLKSQKIAFIVGIDDPLKTEIALQCRDQGILVNVEDHSELCDFHSVSVVRRGDLVIAISTNGKGPALSRRLRTVLEVNFGPEWEGRMNDLAARREALKAEGRSSSDISENLNAMMDELGWFDADDQ